MTTIKPISSAYVNSQYKSDRAEKIKKFINVAVPVIVAAGITKKALSRSGIKLTDIFKNGNASKLWNSVINVLSTPVNFLQNKLSKVGSQLGIAKLSTAAPAIAAPATSGSGLKASLSAIAISFITDLVTRLGAKLVDFICGKADDLLKPKSPKVNE